VSSVSGCPVSANATGNYQLPSGAAALPLCAAQSKLCRRWARIATGGRKLMARIVRCGLIQVHCEWSPEKYSIRDISKKMVEKHEKLIHEAAKKKTQILCLQELFNGPYFCAEQQARWYEMTEPVPEGPTVQRMQKLAKKYGMAIVVPVYEREMTGLFYNTAAVIDADGKYLGKYRKHHIPQVAPGFWEKFYFTPGNTGYLTFRTKFARIGVYICYDRHFPEGARVLGLHGAEIVFNPSATVAGLSEYLWELEQPAHAVANGYFVGAINRVGKEAPWNIGEFYGKSYFCNPRGKIIAQASRDKDEVLVADLDLDEMEKVRQTWQFYRDRRPESYGEITRTQAGAKAVDAAD
jgi:beta-ureidopropionase